MATGPIREQVQLLFLDPVLHIPPLTIDVLVELLWIPWHIDHDEPWVASLGGLLGLGNHPPRSVPARGRVGERTEDSLGLAGLSELAFGAPGPIGGKAFQNRVACQAKHISDSVGITPTHQPPAAEAAIGPDRELDKRPGLAEPPNQQLQECPAVLAGVDLAGPQVSSQQLVTAKDVQGQVAVIVVVTMKKSLLLA